MSNTQGNDPLSGQNVLLVEDEPLIMWMVEDMLRAFGARGVEATLQAEQSVELSSSPIDLAVLDIHLSGDTSFELARRLVADGTPVLFVSGSGPEELPAELQHIPLLAKPFGEHELRSAIGQLMGARSSSTIRP